MTLLALKTGAIVGIVCGAVGALILILLIAYIAISNKFSRLIALYEEAFSTMDIYMKKRFDLIPNLVETVKGYAKHESETLRKVIEARSKVANANTMGEKNNANNELSYHLRGFSKIVEQYPDLKANVNFMDLQKQLQTVENEIANSRKYYNATIRQYNTYLTVFPSSVVGKMRKLEKQPLFEIVEEERQTVKGQF